MHGQYCLRNPAAEIGVVDGAACTPCRTRPAIRELNAAGVVGRSQAIVRRVEGRGGGAGGAGLSESSA
jgi:hypothetical protein